MKQTLLALKYGRKWLGVLLCGLLLSVGQVYALDLDTAQGKGLVGEKINGLIGAVQPNPSSKVQQLIREVNAKRLATYKAISRENGTSLDVVKKLAAKKLLNKLPQGEFYQAPDGSWMRK